MALSKESAAEVLIKISKIHEKRSAQLNNSSANGTLLSSGDKKEAENPVFETFFESGGAEGIMKITNIYPYEIKHIHS